MATQKYQVLRRVDHGVGKKITSYNVGDSIELEDDDAGELLAIGAIAEYAKPPKEEKKA